MKYYDFYVVNGDTVNLFERGDAMPFETISIAELLEKVGFDLKNE